MADEVFADVDWKFVEQAGFKKFATDEQKKIVAEVIGGNIFQCLVGAGDSYVERNMVPHFSSMSRETYPIRFLAWLLLLLPLPPLKTF